MFEYLLDRTGEWFGAKGPESDIVISTRIRIARNMEEFWFPERIKSEDLSRLFDSVQSAAQKSNYLKF